MKIRQYIPNAITTLNLTCGLVSVSLILENSFVYASLFIFLASVFDFFDGMAARLLDARSEFGKQLDSLSDMVSFGVAPGILMFRILSVHFAQGTGMAGQWQVIPYFALLIPICSALRLARFNIDIRQETCFIGMPTPAIAIFFASIPLVVFLQDRIFTLIRLDFLILFLSNPKVLAVLVVFFSYMLVSDFRLFSMKFKTVDWKTNQTRYIFLILTLVLVLLFSISAIPLAIIMYLFLSLIFQKQI
ncbi:MAG: CDP-diacylglycerol--serine O-phosphatidyltransferase [Bacteroidota bacterium]|nr:CDP-diacylglycerol--serine O-phosphatidyltransferase [Bacteroidota bacterium]